MRRWCTLAALALAALLLGANGSAGTVELANSYFFDVEIAGGRSWRVYVSVPPGDAPEAGFPVMYAADGNTQFLTLAETMRNTARRFDITRDAIVVAIGYPPGADVIHERGIDLTPPTDTAGLADNSGGADGLLDYIDARLQPEIARRHPVDESQEAWFGHSFGGLFGLYAFSTRNEVFDRYYLASPSIWWDNRAILDTVRRFVEDSAELDSELHVTVGEYEQSVAPWSSGHPEADQLEKRLTERGQVSNAQEVVRLAASVSGIRTSITIIPGEDHSSVVPASISRAVHRFLRAAH